MNLIHYKHSFQLNYLYQEELIDDYLRHMYTKISDFHFTANNNYKKRVIQLGENKKNVFIANKNYDITKKLIELIDNQIKTIDIK